MKATTFSRWMKVLFWALFVIIVIWLTAQIVFAKLASANAPDDVILQEAKTKCGESTSSHPVSAVRDIGAACIELALTEELVRRGREFLKFIPEETSVVNFSDLQRWESMARLNFRTAASHAGRAIELVEPLIKSKDPRIRSWALSYLATASTWKTTVTLRFSKDDKAETQGRKKHDVEKEYEEIREIWKQALAHSQEKCPLSPGECAQAEEIIRKNLFVSEEIKEKSGGGLSANQNESITGKKEKEIQALVLGEETDKEPVESAFIPKPQKPNREQFPGYSPAPPGEH